MIAKASKVILRISPSNNLSLNYPRFKSKL